MNVRDEMTQLSQVEQKEMMLFSLDNQEYEVALEMANYYVETNPNSADAWYLYGLIQAYTNKTVDSFEVLFEAFKKACQLDMTKVNDIPHDLEDIANELLRYHIADIIKRLESVEMAEMDRYYQEWLVGLERYYNVLENFIYFGKYWDKLHDTEKFARKIHQLMAKLDRIIIEKVLEVLRDHGQLLKDNPNDEVLLLRIFKLFVSLNQYALYAYNHVLHLEPNLFSTKWLTDSINCFYNLYVDRKRYKLKLNRADHEELYQQFYEQRHEFSRILDYLTTRYWEVHSDQKDAMTQRINYLSHRLTSRFLTSKKRNQFKEELEQLSQYLDMPILHMDQVKLATQ